MDEDTPESGAFQGLASLIRLAGFSLPERARFAGGALIMSSISALTVGLVCGQVGGTFFMNSVGPLVPFLVGSWMGFSAGLWNYWSSAKRLALKCATLYPAVLAHALQLEWDVHVPSEVISNSMRRPKRGGLLPPIVVVTNKNYNYEMTTSRSVTTTLDQWILQGGLPRMSLAILSAQGCQTGAAEVFQAERQWLFERQQERRKQVLEQEQADDDE
jgi:hypothetical protein